MFNFPSLYMDFDGQRRAESYFEMILTVSSVVGFIVGYKLQMFSITVASLGAGFILSALISIPPWPMYRRKPLKWQKHVPFTAEAAAAPGGGAGGDGHSAGGSGGKQSKEGKKSGSGKGNKKNN
ncbi:Signal peptidase complex subunit 1 [Tyrophagus putrescentiae]|nr:Signal peptidase complex subunit 1 [Tyrophagus putrescentiae]